MFSSNALCVIVNVASSTESTRSARGASCALFPSSRIENHSQSVIGEQLRVICIELRLNMLYQRVDIGASGPKFIEGEAVVVREFISSVVEDHAAVQSMECFCML